MKCNLNKIHKIEDPGFPPGQNPSPMFEAAGPLLGLPVLEEEPDALQGSTKSNSPKGILPGNVAKAEVVEHSSSSSSGTSKEIAKPPKPKLPPHEVLHMCGT